MIVDTINYKAVWAWLNAVWAKSFVAVVLFLLGLCPEAEGGFKRNYRGNTTMWASGS